MKKLLLLTTLLFATACQPQSVVKSDQRSSYLLNDNQYIIDSQTGDSILSPRGGYSIKEFSPSRDNTKIAYVEVSSKVLPVLMELFSASGVPEIYEDLLQKYGITNQDFESSFVIYDLASSKKQTISNQSLNLVKWGDEYFSIIGWSKNDKVVIVEMKNFVDVGMGGCSSPRYFTINVETASLEELHYDCQTPIVFLDKYSVVAYTISSNTKPSESGCMGECSNHGMLVVKNLENDSEYKIDEANFSYQLKSGNVLDNTTLKYTAISIQNKNEVYEKQLNVSDLVEIK